MNTWRTLYIKELKDHRGVFLFLLIVTLCLDLYASLQVVMGGASLPLLNLTIYAGLALLSYGTVFLLPFILAHSFSSELKAETHYLLLSLPVQRSAIVLCKFLAVLSVGVVLFVLSTATVHLLYLNFRGLVPIGAILGIGISTISGADLWVIMGNGYFSVLLLFLGMVSAMEGLKYAVKRFRGLVTTAFFIGGLYLFILLRGPGMELLDLDRDQGQIVGSELQVQADIGLQSVAFSALVCMVFLGLGMWLFENRAEV